MKVGITCYPTFGGSGVVATELGVALASLGHEVHFISYAWPSRLNVLHERVRFHEVTVTPYPLFDAYPPYTLALATKMAEVADYEELDILHVHYAIPHAISGFLAKQIHPSMKIVTTLHGTDITLVGSDPSYLPITRFGIESSDGVTAVSEWLKQKTFDSLGVKKNIQVIPNFVDPGRFNRSGKTVEATRRWACGGEKLIGHASNFRPVKRIGDVLAAFELVQRKVPSRLLMIGDGPERSKAEAWAREHGVEDRTIFLGNVPDIEGVIAACDLFLLPSETESFGMAALEALASEVPVIATRTGGLPEVIVDGEVGYLVEVGAVEAIAERAIALLENEDLRARMGTAARDHALSKFNVSKVIPRYLSFYQKVMSGS